MKYTRIILISFIILFLELLLIRLISTEIRIFAYLSNLVLLAIFVGIGLGMLIKGNFSLLITSFLLLVILLISITGIFSNITNLISPLSESFIWYQSTFVSISQIIFGLTLTILLFLILMMTFVPLGQALGNIFDNSTQIILFYSINILASFASLWAFYGISWVGFSPYFGIVLIQILIITLVNPKNRIIAILLLSITFLTIFIAKINGFEKIIWSPYQKLTLSALPHKAFQPAGYLLQVNNVGYMGLLNLSKNYQQNLTKKIENKKQSSYINLQYQNQYDIPFLLKPDVKDILIIGAGGGNDVAGAIRANVKSIDAVEIDPKIIEIGQKYHPEQPYSHPNVNVIIDDGRSYFKKTTKKYDLVIMGLADSHTINSSLTNLQLDHYLYTTESFSEIKKILNPEGLLFISFAVQRPWIGARIQNSLIQAFGHQPIIFHLGYDNQYFGWGGVVFVEEINKGTINNYLDQDNNLKNFIDSKRIQFDTEANASSDDWPYLYLDKKRIPSIHLIISFLLVIIFLILKKTLPLDKTFDLNAFFLGAGFLLFEFQNISKSALMFGNTWQTNLYTISAVLVFILIANLITAKRPLPFVLSYSLLFLSFIPQFIIPLASINSLPSNFKIVLGPLFLNLPLLFSSMIFISLFTTVSNKKVFLASNLIGSAIGGIFGFISYALGIKAILSISFLLYFLSIIKFVNYDNLRKVVPLYKYFR